MAVDIARIEQMLKSEFGGICERTFINNVPPALDSPVDSYLVIDAANNVLDRGPYLDTYCYIYVYVRKRESGVQDSPKIDAMVNQVLSKIPICNDLFSLYGTTVGFGRNRGDFVETMIRSDMIIKQ